MRRWHRAPVAPNDTPKKPGWPWEPILRREPAGFGEITGEHRVIPSRPNTAKRGLSGGRASPAFWKPEKGQHKRPSSVAGLPARRGRGTGWTPLHFGGEWQEQMAAFALSPPPSVPPSPLLALSPPSLPFRAPFQPPSSPSGGLKEPGKGWRYLRHVIPRRRAEASRGCGARPGA